MPQVFKKAKIAIPGPKSGRGFDAGETMEGIKNNFLDKYDEIKDFFDELAEDDK